MHRFNLARLKRMRGNRRRIVKMRPLKARPADRRELASIGNQMVEFIFGFRAEFMRALGDPSMTTDSAPDDLERLVTLILTQTNEVMARLRLKVRAWGARVEERHRADWADAVLVATGVDLSTVLDPNDVSVTVSAVVNRSVELIRDIGDESRKRIANIVFAAVTNRTPPAEVAAQIREIEPMSRRRAINIAADQANKLNASLDRARQEEAGITHFTWRHSGKMHPRPEHVARNGKIYAWADPPSDLPGQLPFCGCSAQATLIDEEDQVETVRQVDLEDA